ncbi:MAG: TolC family protein, partial [Pseudomonadota bacterium]
EDLRVAEEAEKTAEAHVKLAEDLFQAGQVVKSDLLSAQVRLSEVKEMVIQAKNGLTMGRAALNKAIGIEQNEAIEVQGTLEYEPKDLVLEDLINEALQNRPDLLALENQVKNSEEGIKMAKTSFLPSLNFMAQYDLNDKNDLWNASGESWTIWGIFHFNLFEGLNGIYKVKEANESLNQFSSQREALRNEIEFEVRGAFYQLRDAEERVKVAGEAINHAQESLRIVDDRYRVGLSTMVEVLDNEVALTRVKRNYLKAVHDCRVARAKIDLVKGTLSATH